MADPSTDERPDTCCRDRLLKVRTVPTERCPTSTRGSEFDESHTRLVYERGSVLMPDLHVLTIGIATFADDDENAHDVLQSR